MSEVQLSKTSAKIIIGPTSNPNSQKLKYGFPASKYLGAPDVPYHKSQGALQYTSVRLRVAGCASVYQRKIEVAGCA